MRNPIHSVTKRLARLRKGPVLARRLGAIWLLYPRDWIDNRIYIAKPYERPQIAYAIQCIANNGLTGFFDCGANIGYYSVQLALQFPELRVTAFEPVPRTYCRLVSNVGLNGLEQRVSLHNAGLGERPERRTIAYASNSSGVATLDPDAAGLARRNYDAEVEIDILSLDETAAPAGERLFLKIDVEGFELAALAGMRKLLADNHCIVQIEIWDKNLAAAKQFFAAMNYALINRIEDDFYFSNFA